MGRDLRKELEAFTDEPAEPWAPEPGDIVEGEFERLDRGSTQYGNYDILILRENRGSVRAVWLMHAVLKGEFARLQPTPGDCVAIKRLADSGKGYRRYRMVVERRGNRSAERPGDAASDGRVVDQGSGTDGAEARTGLDEGPPF